MSNLRAICCRLQPHHHHQQQVALLLYGGGGGGGCGVPATSGSMVIGRSRGFSISVSVSIHQNPNTISSSRGRRRLSSPPPCASASSRFRFHSSENCRRTSSPSSLSSINHHSRKRATFASVRAAANWADHKSPYDTLELERDADDEKIKLAYRRLAKFYHPDVYDGRGTLEEGETAEARFIKIQAAYELLIDGEKRRQYDMDNRVNPMKASQAWMEWLMKKRKAFDQRGDMAIAAWAEQQQRELNLRVRRLSRSKIDPDEERRILAREKKASLENFNNTLKRHTLVLKKRDLMRKKAEEEKQKLISKLLAAEGLELAADKDEDEDEGEASP